MTAFDASGLSCPCADCVNGVPPRRPQNPTMSDMYVIELHRNFANQREGATTVHTAAASRDLVRARMRASLPDLTGDGRWLQEYVYDAREQVLPAPKPDPPAAADNTVYGAALAAWWDRRCPYCSRPRAPRRLHIPNQVPQNGCCYLCVLSQGEPQPEMPRHSRACNARFCQELWP